MKTLYQRSYSIISVWSKLIGLFITLLSNMSTASGQLYYVLNDGSATTRNDQFRKRNADGTNDALVVSGFADSPGSVVVNSTTQKAYVLESRVSTTSRIYVVDLTSNTSSTFLTSTSMATGAALDKAGNYLYYTASDGLGATQNDYLRRIGLDGSGDVAISASFVSAAGNVALDLANNRAFVAERLFNNSKIYAVNVSTGAVSVFLTPTAPVSTTVTVRGMAVDAANGYLYYAVNDNDGSRNDDALYRINLDGTGNTQLATGFVYSIGDIALDATNQRLYVSDILTSDPKVVSIDLSNNGVTSFFTSTSQVTGMAIIPQSCPAQFTVNSTDDGADATPGDGVCATSGGVCTLRAAIQEANALTSCPGSLSIQVGVTGTINIGSTLPITRSIAIIGPGADQLTISGQASTFQLFNVTGDNLSVWFSGLTLAKGGSGSENAAAIEMQSGNGGSVSSLSVVACNLNNNAASLGQIYAYKSNVFIQNSTISNNSAGDGIDLEYGEATGFSVLIENATISHNAYAGIYLNNNNISTITVTNSTFAGNTIGFFMGGNCAATVQFKNSILANSSQFSGPGAITILSQGNNICTDASLSPTSTGDEVNTDPLLAALDNYGGPTLTHALLPGSPAIDAGSSAGTPTTDQRGVGRVGATDIGAFESRGFTLAVTSGDNQSTSTSHAFTNPLTVAVSNAFSEPVNGGVVSFSVPASGASASLSSGTAITSGGLASVTATANATVGGPYSVTATGPGLHPVSFALTNIPCSTTVAINPPSGVLSCSLTSQILTATASGNYRWSTNETTSSITVTTAGVYSLTLTDLNGCSGTASAAVSQDVSAPTATITPSSGTIACSSGSVSLTASGGSSYRWDDNSTSAIRTVTDAGTYSVTVTGGNGCTATASASLTAQTHPDYQPLVDLYNSTNGAGWTNKTGWLSGCDPCTGNGGSPWYGVTCVAGRVVRLQLGNNQLSGSLPSSLSALSLLNMLNLSANQLTGSIPDGLSVLPNLQSIDLNTNKLTGSIPNSFSALTILTDLGLQYNKLTGSIPSSFSVLTNLTGLFLQGNQLSGSIPGSFSALTHIQFLNFSENQLSGSIPASFSALSSLNGLILNNNQLSGSIPSSLSALTNLQQLFLNSNQLSGSIPSSLSSLTNLQYLYLTNNQLIGCYPASLTALCGVPNKDFSSNGGLPGGGSATAFAAFCSSGQGSDAFVATAMASMSAVCVGGEVNLSTSGGSSYTWTAPAGAVLTSSASASVTTARLTTAGVQTFTVVVSNGGTCSQTTTVSVTADGGPTASILPSSSTLTCSSGSVSLTATGGTAYKWDDNSTNAVRTVSSSGTYSVTVTSGNGCTATTTTSIASATVLVTSALASQSVAAVGSVISLSASGGSTYQWSSPAGAVFTSSASSSVVSVSLLAAGPQAFTVVISQGGCTDTQLVSVTATNGPDLTATVNLPDASFPSAPSTKNFTVNLYEVGWVSTSSGSVTITLTAPYGYTLSFNGELGSLAVSGGSTVVVNNGNWEVVSNESGAQLSVKLKAGFGIGGGGSSVVGFSLVRTLANGVSVSNLTVNVNDDGSRSYDINTINNIYARVLNGL